MFRLVIVEGSLCALLIALAKRRFNLDLSISCNCCKRNHPGLMLPSEDTLVDDRSWNLLSRVACTGTADEVEFLIKNGADVHWKNEYGWNALFESVYGGKLDVLLLLSRYLPEWLSYRDVRGYTALHVAAEEGHVHIIKHLISQGANWQVRSFPVESLTSSDITPGITPAEAARNECPLRERRFLELVEEMKAGAVWATAHVDCAVELEANHLPLA